MTEYPKIQTIYKRDMINNPKGLLEGQWTLPEFEYLANNPWTFTEKVDGTNIRIIIVDHNTIAFGGRTNNAQMPGSLVAALQDIFDPNEALLHSMFPHSDGQEGPSAVLYGEGYGAGIQKAGGNYRQDKGFVLFDVRVGQWWLQRADVEDIASKLGLDVVPIIGEGTLYDAVNMAKAGFESRWGHFEAEGIVARPKTELCMRSGKRVITKIKCCDFVVDQIHAKPTRTERMRAAGFTRRNTHLPSDE